MFTASANGRSVVSFTGRIVPAKDTRPSGNHDAPGMWCKSSITVSPGSPCRSKNDHAARQKVFRFFHAPRMQRGIVLEAMSGRRLHLLREAREGKIAEVFF